MTTLALIVKVASEQGAIEDSSMGLTLYFIDVCYSLKIISILVIVLYAICIFFIAATCDDIPKALKEWFEKTFWVFCITVLVSIVTPSEETLYLMLGSKYLNKTSPPTKVEQIINKKLDRYLIGQPQHE